MDAMRTCEEVGCFVQPVEEKAPRWWTEGKRKPRSGPANLNETIQADSFGSVHLSVVPWSLI